MLNFLKELPEKAVVALFIGIAIAIASVPIGLLFIAINVGGFTFQNNDTSITLKGKELKGKELTTKTNENQIKLEQEFNILLEKNKQLTEAAKEKKVDPKLIEEAEEAQIKTETRIQDLSANTEALNNFVEETVVEP